MKTLINKIKDFNFDKISFEDLNDFFNTNGLPIIGHKIPLSSYVYRCRRNNNYFDLFYFEKDITYRTDIKNIKTFGRANFPNSSKFYGAIPTNEIDEGYLISILETSTNIRNEIDGIEFFTVGQWVTKREFNVVTIVPDLSIKKLSEINEYLIQLFNNYKSSNSFTADQLAFHELIGVEFSKKVKINQENEYALSSAFSEAILQNPNIGGIIYPSVQSKYKGINIVLNPKNADELLHLKEIKFGAFYNFGHITTFNSYFKTEIIQGYPFRWERDVMTKDFNHIIDFYNINGVNKDLLIKELHEQIKRMKFK